MSCDYDSAPVSEHSPPVLFDLDDDPAESNPLDLTDPFFGAVAEHMKDLLEKVNNDIANDFKSVMDDRESTSAFPCCNILNKHCHC